MTEIGLGGVHECIRAITAKFDGPFERPITLDRETGELSVSRWAIKVYKLTKGNNISKSGGGYLYIEFCPLCGERLVPEEEKEE